MSDAKNLLIGRIQLIRDIPIGHISTLAQALQTAHAEIDCETLMYDLYTDIYGAKKDVQAIVDVIMDRHNQQNMMTWIIYVSTGEGMKGLHHIVSEDDTVEIDKDSRNLVTQFRELLKENARLSGWTEAFADEYTTASLVKVLIQYGFHDFLKGVNYAKAHQGEQ